VRVLIDTTYALRAPLSGTGVYISRLCDELGRIDDVELIPLANRRRRPPAGGGFGSVRNALTDLRWTTAELPRLARRTGAQLIHHPLPACSRWAQIPQVVTIVDLAFERLPQHFDRRFRVVASRSHRAAVSAASAVVTISETTAADARELWGVAGERIVVAPLGPGQELDPAAPVSLARRHFLYVGDAEPRKNLGVLLAAYELYRGRAEDPIELVLAGSVDARATGVQVVRRPDRTQLAELYAGAVALVHPSLYEGFGLTLLEAMRLGAPVIAARAPGTVETCGYAARYADPHDPDSFAAAMLELCREPAVRGELQRRGHERAGAFSWATCARRHVVAYSLALRDENRDPRHQRHSGLLQRL
jgi:glycosyltransferase involved in cell wall biosynthesis